MIVMGEGLLALCVCATAVCAHQWHATTARDTTMRPASSNDSVLVAYRVDDVDVAFAVDGHQSAFWQAWGDADSMVLAAPGSCVPESCSFTDGKDARVMIKSAASTNGIYFLVHITDNWRIDADGAGGDKVVLRMDRISPEDIEMLWAAALVEPWAATRSHSAWSLEIPPGLSSRVRLESYSESSWTWSTVDLATQELNARHGIRIDVCSTQVSDQQSSDQRFMELFIPWSNYCGGLPPDTMLGGQHFAFCAGYDDADWGQGSRGILRWFYNSPFDYVGKEAYGWGKLYLCALPPEGSNATDERRTNRVSAGRFNGAAAWRMSDCGVVVSRTENVGGEGAWRAYDLRGRAVLGPGVRGKSMR